jgi:hypothetical protein
MGIQADSKSVPGSGRKRKFLSLIHDRQGPARQAAGQDEKSHVRRQAMLSRIVIKGVDRTDHPVHGHGHDRMPAGTEVDAPDVVQRPVESGNEKRDDEDRRVSRKRAGTVREWAFSIDATGDRSLERPGMFIA